MSSAEPSTLTARRHPGEAQLRSERSSAVGSATNMNTSWLAIRSNGPSSPATSSVDVMGLHRSASPAETWSAILAAISTLGSRAVTLTVGDAASAAAVTAPVPAPWSNSSRPSRDPRAASVAAV